MSSSQSGRQKAKENLERVLRWIAERDVHGDFADYERGGKINRAALCSELSFGRSVCVQNPAVRSALSEAEKRWFGKKEEDKQAHEAARERSERKTALVNSENSRLQDELAKLKAENTALRRQLEKYAAMDEVIRETGYAPR